MRKLAFTVEGEPASWQVFTRYDESDSKARLKAYQGLIQATAREAMQGLPPHEGPVVLDVTFCRSYPKSAPKRNREEWGEKNILKRPDRTNFQKGAEDALNNIVYLDDSQVIRGHSAKVYREPPCTEFIITLL